MAVLYDYGWDSLGLTFASRNSAFTSRRVCLFEAILAEGKERVYSLDESIITRYFALGLT
jgi:hypothetical protein